MSLSYLSTCHYKLVTVLEDKSDNSQRFAMDTWKPRSLILGQRLYLSTHHKKKKIRKKWERDRERESETEILTKLERSVDSPNGLKQISSFLCFYPQFFC